MTGHSPRIWIVDDEADMRSFLRVALEDAGYRVREFARAEGVVAAARPDPPDLICMDIVMPVRSGISLYRELRQSRALDGVPVVILSGFARPEEDIAAEFSNLLGDPSIPGPDGYLDKPVVLDEFLALATSLVHRREGLSA